jgi:hypothetical protein
MKVSNIKWETDGEVVDLPNEVNVPDGIDDEAIADYLSDTYGWLVESFSVDTDRDYFGEFVNEVEGRAS